MVRALIVTCKALVYRKFVHRSNHLGPTTSRSTSPSAFGKSLSLIFPLLQSYFLVRSAVESIFP
jgi:hypothetical protein